METNKHLFSGGEQKENPYHSNIRTFAKGNVSIENKKGNNKMVHIRIPMYAYYELRELADSKNVPVGRLMIEILRTVADKRVKSKQEWNDPM